ncbi:MAG: hypothetical protein WDW38_010060 [Sanguina aurantia]
MPTNELPEALHAYFAEQEIHYTPPHKLKYEVCPAAEARFRVMLHGKGLCMHPDSTLSAFKRNRRDPADPVQETFFVAQDLVCGTSENARHKPYVMSNSLSQEKEGVRHGKWLLSPDAAGGERGIGRHSRLRVMPNTVADSGE